MGVSVCLSADEWDAVQHLLLLRRAQEHCEQGRLRRTDAGHEAENRVPHPGSSHILGDLRDLQEVPLRLGALARLSSRVGFSRADRSLVLALGISRQMRIDVDKKNFV